MRSMRWTLLPAMGLLGLGALMTPTAACNNGGGQDDGPDISDNHLVSTAWLADHQDDSDLVIIDARESDAYLEGHIPGAVSASFSEEEMLSHGVDISYGGGLDYFVDLDGPIPFQDGSPEKIQQAVRSFGINEDSVVVVYDAGVAFDAARFFSTLEYHGFEEIYLLDGGFYKWQSEERPTTEQVPEVTPGDFVAEIEDPSIRVDTDYAVAAVKDPERQLLTSLLPSWYYGDYLAYAEPGHIPRSYLIPLRYFYNSDATWRSSAEIRALVEFVGMRWDREIITYCGGGPLSAATYFGLKHVAGHAHTRNYQGSVVAWMADPRGLALDMYQHPERLRDATHISWWAGDRIQHLLEDPPALVVDTRSEAAHDAGHIPWSVSLPAGDATDLVARTSAEWATRLGERGVAPGQEVILCDTAITPRTALLTWLLEYLGHGHVSLCRRGVGGWEAAGFELTTEETLITPPEDPIDVAVHPKEFVPDVQDELRLADASSSPVDERFARMWLVASPQMGASLPFDPEDESHVHVPWDELYTAEGRLRPAPELLTVLQDAELERFSEIVCTSDRLAEAAAAYVALRIMGYPRVRLYLPEDAGVL